MARPPTNTTTAAPTVTALTDADLRALLGRLVVAAGPPPQPVNTQALLAQKPRVTVAFPPCASELLSLIRPNEPGDEISGFFNEYFRFTRHRVFGQDLNGQELDTQLAAVLDPDLLGCLSGAPGGPVITRTMPAWPSDCCICAPCVTLDGNRNPPPFGPNAGGIRRLFVGDAVWLFYFERMGLSQILGAILDAYANNGRLPISSGAVEPGILDDIVGLVLEIMVRQTSMGLASRARDRALLLRRSVGWTTDAGRKLNVDSEVNTSFNVLFHKFLFHALEFYRDKRLAVAIQGVTSVARPSAATLVTISETLELLTKRFEPFYYGRNYYNALNGIVWSIAALSIIRALARTLGIPGAFGDPHEFVPAAYDLLVAKRPVTNGDTNRYIVHRECARHGRDLLLDMEVINFRDTSEGGALDAWLTQVEGKVEAYRTSYRSMTGVDIGTSPTPVIEQQA